MSGTSGDGTDSGNTGGSESAGVNLFRVPHSRMKELVNHNLLPLTNSVNKSMELNSDSLESLLQDVYEAMWELKSHEYIENHFIMDRLKARLQSRRVNTLKQFIRCTCKRGASPLFSNSLEVLYLKNIVISHTSFVIFESVILSPY